VSNKCVVCGKSAGVHPTLCSEHDPDFGAKNPSSGSNSQFSPGARVVWEGTVRDVHARVVVDGEEAFPQTDQDGTWGHPHTVPGWLALERAVVTLSRPPALSAPPAPNPGLSVYLDLEQRALAADGQDEALAEAYRSVMDGAWNTHLSASDRRWLNARGAVGSPAGPVPGREDGNRKA
jgi:hypothetical protein